MHEDIRKHITETRHALEQYGHQKKWFFGKKNTQKLSYLKNNPAQAEALRVKIASYEQSDIVVKFFKSIFWSYTENYLLLNSFYLSEKINALESGLADNQKSMRLGTSVLDENTLPSLVSEVVDILDKLKNIDFFGEILTGFRQVLSSLNSLKQGEPTLLPVVKYGDDFLKDVKAQIADHNKDLGNLGKGVAKFSKEVDEFPSEIKKEVDSQLRAEMEKLRQELMNARDQSVGRPPQDRKGGVRFFEAAVPVTGGGDKTTTITPRY